MRPSVLLFPAGLLCLLLAACGDRGEETTPDAGAGAPEGPATQEVDAKSVAAADEYGPFASPITGVALWANPLRAFDGLIFAASADGLVSYNIEDGAEIARDDTFSAAGVAIGYNEGGAGAEAVIASLDADTGQFRFYTIDNDTRMPALRPAMMVTNKAENGFCIGRTMPGRDNDLQLATLSGGSYTSHALRFTAAGVSTVEGDAGSISGDLAACAVDDLTGAILLADRAGSIYRSLGGVVSAEPFAAAAAIGNVAGLGVALNENKDTGEIEGQIALLDGADGAVHLFDLRDGRALGVMRIGASFDVDEVARATAMGVGYGNYGAVYRNGVLALASAGEAPALRLVPWNGVLSVIDQPESLPANPRELRPDADDGLIIDIDLIDPQQD